MTQTISQLHDLEEYTEILSKDTLSTNEKTLEGISQPDILQQIALGLTYHEICVLHFMLGKDKSYAPYAGKALTVLTAARPNAPDWSLPMLDSYINSSRSLVAATKGNLISLLKVIRTYDKLIDTYSAASYHPEFLQASLLENLPNVFGAHAKAKKRLKVSSANTIMIQRTQRPKKSSVFATCRSANCRKTRQQRLTISKNPSRSIRSVMAVRRRLGDYWRQ